MTDEFEKRAREAAIKIFEMDREDIEDNFYYERKINYVLECAIEMAKWARAEMQAKAYEQANTIQSMHESIEHLKGELDTHRNASVVEHLKAEIERLKAELDQAVVEGDMARNERNKAEAKWALAEAEVERLKRERHETKILAENLVVGASLKAVEKLKAELETSEGALEIATQTIVDRCAELERAKGELEKEKVWHPNWQAASAELDECRGRLRVEQAINAEMTKYKIELQSLKDMAENYRAKCLDMRAWLTGHGHYPDKNEGYHNKWLAGVDEIEACAALNDGGET